MTLQELFDSVPVGTFVRRTGYLDSTLQKGWVESVSRDGYPTGFCIGFECVGPYPPSRVDCDATDWEVVK